MRSKIAGLAAVAAITGAFVWARPHNKYPSDLRDAVGSGDTFSRLEGAASVGGDLAKSVPASPAPVPAEGEFYLDLVSGRQVEVCGNTQAGEVLVSEDCSGYFTKKYSRRPDEITRRVPGYDGLREGFKDYVMVSGRLMLVYRLYADGTVQLDDPAGDGAGYYQMNAAKLEREVPAGEVWNGFAKGYSVCLKQDHEFNEEAEGGGVLGLFRPFPYYGRKGEPFMIMNLFKSGFARVRAVSGTDKRALLRPVDLRLVEPCTAAAHGGD
ncbi:MAG: hypothetical protein PHV36_14635 [Elusimicrobiales bacterium]|nr:hypothetical protein [Elusimicrobiales bacterium]